jgi:hypothetical protein
MPVEAVLMCLTTNKLLLTHLLQNYGAQCGAATKLSFAKAENLPRTHTLHGMWSDGLAPSPESLVSIDATNCTNASSGLNVHVLNGVASIERGVGNAAPHKSAHHCKSFFSQTRTKYGGHDVDAYCDDRPRLKPS